MNTDVYAALSASLAFENNIVPSVATQIVQWLDTEGVLDYDILKETYLGDTAVNDNEGVRE